MKSDKEHKMNHRIEEALRVNPYVHTDEVAAWNDFSRLIGQPASKPVKIRTMSAWEVVKVAASIVILSGMFIWMSQPVQFTRELITKDEIATVQLFEGSQIRAGKNTILQYPSRSEGIVYRRVVLEKGIAEFDVNKHELPFIVVIDNLEIQVTGTVFSVEKKAGEVLVKMVEGKVKIIKNKDASKPLILVKDDVLLDSQGELFVSRNGQPFEQISNFTYLSKLKAAEKLATSQKENPDSQPNGDVGGQGSTYRMSDVIKFLDKKFKKELKFRKKRKLKSKETVILNLEKDLLTILQSLKQKNLIDFTEGKCEGCYIVSPVESPK